MANPAASIRHLAAPRERLARIIACVHQHAIDVDAEARFPFEAFEAIKRERLLGIMIPKELGGEGAELAEIAELCAELGQACASTAMIFAMHSIKVSSLVTHGCESAWHRNFMTQIVDQQLLLGSATTEAGIGGDMRNSICAIASDGGQFTLTKNASVISYARECDAILVTARRSEDVMSSDQIMAVVLRAQYTLENTHSWDTMGMRGTCSEGFVLRCKAPDEQIFPHAFADIAAQSMLAMAHLMWASAWYGVSADAVTRAQAFVRSEARRKPGVLPLGAVRLSRAATLLQDLQSTIQCGIQQYESLKQDHDKLSTMAFSVAMNTIKLGASQTATAIVQECLMITGIAGYRNDTKFSVARHLRDILSAQLMVHNDRIEANNANLLLAGKLNTRLAQ